VFLLLGDQVLFPYFIEHIDTSLVAIAAVVLSRAVAIYGFSALSGWLTGNPIPWAEQTVLWWVGLRGSVAIALALSIPALVSDRQQIISNSFGVVLFTLLAQGLTTKPLLDRLNLLEDQHVHTQYLQLLARRTALQQVLDHLTQPPSAASGVSGDDGQELEFVNTQLAQIQQEMTTLQQTYPQLKDYLRQQRQETLVAIETATYADFVRQGYLKSLPAPILAQAFESTAPKPGETS